MGERQQQFYGNVHTWRERQGALTAGIEPVRQVRGFSLPEVLTRAEWLASGENIHLDEPEQWIWDVTGHDYFFNWL